MLKLAFDGKVIFRGCRCWFCVKYVARVRGSSWFMIYIYITAKGTELSDNQVFVEREKKQ